jgi:nucleoside 2-deoxyribosyltransferase
MRVAKRRVYIAGLFDSQERLRVQRDAMIAMGYIVTSSWLEESPDTAFTTDKWADYAERDLAEVEDSHFIVVDTLDVTPRGGREVEMGYAMALNKPVFVVGPMRNVFHHIADEVFADWDEALRYFADYVL